MSPFSRLAFCSFRLCVFLRSSEDFFRVSLTDLNAPQKQNEMESSSSTFSIFPGRKWVWALIMVRCVTSLLTSSNYGRMQIVDDMVVHPSSSPPVAAISSLEPLCAECQEAWVKTLFPCTDRIHHYLQLDTINVTSIVEAQTIVSREFTECSVCDPTICRKMTIPTLLRAS